MNGPQRALLPSIERRHISGVVSVRDLPVVEGDGAIVRTPDGRSFIDLIGGHGVTLLGHCHPCVVQAIQEQAARLITCSASFPNDQRAALYQRLESLMPDGLQRFFLCNSGTEAVEAALKFAMMATGRSGVVALKRSFHGRTLGALATTWSPKYREPFQGVLQQVHHVAPEDENALREAVNDATACVIMEPVQGEGGVHSLSDRFLHQAEKVCRARGAMLILDEIQCGLGRTGTMWAHEPAGIRPDLLCIGKGVAGGMPMGVVALGPRIPVLPRGTHGSTFGGNPLACAAADATLRVLADEELAVRSRRLGEQALNHLRSLEGPAVREVRGRGLMIAIDLKERAKPYLDALEQRGVLALAGGTTIIRLLPALTIDVKLLQRALEVFSEVLSGRIDREGSAL